MSLIDKYNKVYRVPAKCVNCGKIAEQKIPLGITYKEYLKDDLGKCPKCGTSKLEKVTEKDLQKWESEKARMDEW